MANPRARPLGRDATEAERRPWSAPRDRRLAGYSFRRRHPVPGAILDFAYLGHRLAIEADGGQHTEEADARRTAAPSAAGGRLIRVWNADILRNTEGVVTTIIAALEHPP